MMKKGAKEMIKDALDKIARAVKATLFAVGLAVMLAATLGVATTALAAVPGDPLKLGQLNSINALTRLAGSNAGAIFVVDNNSRSGGRGLWTCASSRASRP